ncbi:PH-interacting protein [Schistocerca nitens]|uniref:PH-interacting protein n=1 Tax=Schistocerca nitens TaxID=7011 RepID=UPI0021190E1B|nr:PH-interacting protein [Schistocerca nitens]
MENKIIRQRSQCASELYFLITKFLDASPCHQTAAVLKQELQRLKILPRRLDWQGNEHEQTFGELERKYPHIGPNHLLEVCRRLGPLLDQELKPSLPGLTSLLGAGRQSLLRTQKDHCAHNLSIVDYAVRIRGCPLIDPAGVNRQHNLVKVLQGRELSGPLKRHQAVSSKLYSKLQLYCRTLGHLSAVYCLLFDRTGRYVITGADDLLVKIWSAIDGRLLATLRGASSEITDIAVNVENTLLAAGSLDKILRIWSLQTSAPVAVLTGHTGMITSVHFSPMIKYDMRYVVTTSTDGSVAFWIYHRLSRRKYNFIPKPIVYNERMRPGQAQMICAAFSPGGLFLAAGSADHHVRIYLMTAGAEDGPTRILEVEGHSDRVDSIQWANTGLRFITGSKDGTAQVWQFKCQEWRPLQLTMSTKLPGSSDTTDDPKVKLRVSMVCWNRSDQFVITAVSDYSIKVWNSSTGALVQVLRGHKDEVFVLEAHPFEANILLSAGHDGQLIIWDIIAGTQVISFQNSIEGQGHGALFDAKWSPDGTMLAASDSHGHLLVYGFGRGSDRFHKLPKEMFFHTDYRPLIRDDNHHVLDEQTQIAPHLMPPPFLVDIDGNPYPPFLQRLVPGRENCQGEQLIPNVAWLAGGHQEVIEGLPTSEPRSNIDQMIAALANRQLGSDGSAAAEAGEQSRPNLAPRAGPRFGFRRNGDVEGVRQSSGNWQRDTDFCWNRGTLIKPFDSDVLQDLWHKQTANYNSEMEQYRIEQCRRPPEPPPQPPSTVVGKRRRGVRNQHQHNYRTRAAQEQNVNAESENPENNDVTASLSSATDHNNDDSTAREEDLASMSSSSDTESSEYSDWVADAGVNLEPPKRSPVRRRAQAAQTNHRPIRQRKKVFPAVNNLSEVPEAFRPTEWLSEIIPRKAPYYPQMGDEVVYFRQGHQLYLNAVRNKKLYDLGNRCEPWAKQTIRAHELVKVIGIKYEIRPPRLCCLKLGLMNPDGRLTGENFTIKYHDMPDVLDFLVLKQTYDTAVARNWRVGDRFRCMIDDSWWMGVIESQSPLEQEFPDSHFMCYKVRWDNGEYEHMSPWDLEPINEDRLPRITGGAVPVLPQEIQATLYQPQPEEWPMGDRDAACRRILAGLDQVMSLSIAEPFIAPVDLNQYPSYAYVVEYPIDLSTIKGRFENRFYRRVTSAQFDVRYIATNAEKFNEPGSQIVKKARIVTDLCLRVIKDRNFINVPALYHQLLDAYQSSDSEYEVDLNEPGPSNGRRRSNRLTLKRNLAMLRSSKQKDWQGECRQLLEMLWQCGDSAPFREPVDALEHPDYYQVIDTPMDLRTVKEDLLGGNYQSPLEFAKDVRLIFSNSKNYNTNNKSRIYCMTVRLSAMFEVHMETIILNWKSARRRELSEKRETLEIKPLRPVTGVTTRRATNCLKAVNGAGTSRELNNDSEDSDTGSEVEEKVKKPITRKAAAHKKPQGGEAVTNGHIRSKSSSHPAIRLKINFQNVKTGSESDSESRSRSKSNSSSGSGNDSSSSSSSNGSTNSTASSSSSSDSTNKSNTASTSTASSKKKKTKNDRKNNNINRSSSSTSSQSSRKLASLRITKTRIQTRGKKRMHPTDSDDDYRVVAATTSVRSVRTRNRGRQRVHYQDQLSDRGQGGDSDSESASVPIRTARKVSRRSQHYREETDDSDDRVEPRRSTRPHKRRYLNDAAKSDGGSSEGTDGVRNLRPSLRTPAVRRPRRRAVSSAHYAEDSGAESSDHTPAVSVSSRGRVRKLTPRARALFAK